MAGLKDIAAAAGVSVGTASDILNRGRADRYTSATRQRVLEISRRVEYRPFRTAQAMRSNRTGAVGFAAANFAAGMLDNIPTTPFVTGLNHQFSTAGCYVGLIELAELEDSAQRGRPWTLKERFFDALVIHYGLSDRATRFAANLGVPVLWWDSGVFEPTNCIYRDEQQVSRDVTRSLIDLGHRRIGYLVGQTGWEKYQAGQTVHYSYAHRYESYRDQMRSAGLVEAPLIGYDPDSLARQMRDQRITAIVQQGANITVVSEAAHRLNWRIAEQLTVASLDIEARVLMRGVEVGGMLYDRYEAGREAARMVLKMLEGDSPQVPSITIKGSFRAGRTIVPPPADCP